MPALNFSKRFADAVESGAKRQTIRAVRKHPIRVSDILYHYTGMRTKACRGLGETVCKDVTTIQICRHVTTGAGSIWSRHGILPLDDEFAQADGFDNAEDMLQWFEKTHGLPFNGVLIRW